MGFALEEVKALFSLSDAHAGEDKSQILAQIFLAIETRKSDLEKLENQIASALRGTTSIDSIEAAFARGTSENDEG